MIIPALASLHGHHPHPPPPLAKAHHGRLLSHPYRGLALHRMREGKHVVVHCRGGLGRTGTVAACVLVALGNHSADEAIDAVRAARRGTVQTRNQEDFVRRFETTFRGREGKNR